MNRRKLTIVIFVISLSLALIFSMLCIHVYLYESLSDKNTTLFSATIKEVSILGTSAEDYTGIIDTEEYPSSLMVENIDGLIYSDSFQNLHPGETIYFRVQNYGSPLNEDYLKTVPFTYIVSLETSESQVLSLERYQTYNKSRWIPTIKVVSFVCILFLAISIHCALLLKGINVFSRFKRHK